METTRHPNNRVVAMDTPVASFLRALGALTRPCVCVRSRTARRARLLAASLVILSGCASLGPSKVTVDRFDYNAAIASSTNEQMLLNLVRLRYNETPVFLDVSTVIAQYQVDARASIGAEVGLSGTAGAPGDSILIPEVGAGWQERPTITFAPRSGPIFIRSMLTPIPPSAILGLLQGNWPVDDVVWGVVRSINGVAPRSPSTGQWNPDYPRMLDALALIQRSGAIGLGRSGDASAMPTLRFRVRNVDAKTEEAIATLKRLWALDPGVNEYKLVLGLVPSAPDEIAVLTSSMLDLMRDISGFVDVPPEHVDQGRTAPTRVLPAEAPNNGRPPVRVLLHRNRPADAFVAVRKDGWWYSIAANDPGSKRVLFLLNILFQLAESSERPGGPVVTIPAGG